MDDPDVSNWKVMATCIHNNEAARIIVNSNTNVMALSEELCSKFCGLCLGSFELRYSIQGQSERCVLNSESDVYAMVLAALWERCKFVDIFIVPKNALVLSDKSTSSSCHEMGSSSTCSTEYNDKSIVSANQYMGVYKETNSKKLLSDAWKGLITKVDQSFDGGVEEFRLLLRQFAMENGFQYDVLKSEPGRFTAACKNRNGPDKCQWRIHASKKCESSAFYIKSFEPTHTCLGRLRDPNTNMVKASLITSIYKDKVRRDPLLGAKAIVSDFKENYGFDIPYHIAWKGKEVAQSVGVGEDSESYNRLYWYLKKLVETNPNSVVVLERDSELRFERLFICFHGCIEGFRYCRPFLFIDGTFIKSKFKGAMLCATAKNGNQGFFPFAFALVSAENDDNWEWFLQQLSLILTPQGRPITFSSDRHAGIIKGIAQVFPTGFHSYCLLHLKRNLRSRYAKALSKTERNSIIDAFSSCAYSSTELIYYTNLKLLSNVGGQKAIDFVNEIPLENWVNAFFPGKRYGELYNNVAESFNNWIRDERSMPIYQMVDCMRSKIMSFNAERLLQSRKWNSILCLDVNSLLETKLLKGASWVVSRCSDFVFEVREENVHVVDLQLWTCTCHRWQLFGFPCSHATTTIQSIRGCVFDYIEDYFKKDFYQMSYSFPIYPVPDIEQAIISEQSVVMLRPPITRRPPGRPGGRIPSIGEKGKKKTYKCGRCGKYARHNRKTCTAPLGL